jgi:hypothetical protein
MQTQTKTTKGQGKPELLMKRADYDWITTTLINDEASSDEEMTEHFQREGEMTHAEAVFYVAQRNEALRDNLHFNLQDWEGAK